MVTISPHKACLMNQTEIASDGYGQCDGLCVDRHGHEACIASLLLVPVQSSACSRDIPYCGECWTLRRWWRAARKVGIVYGFQDSLDSSANVPSDDCYLLFMAIVKIHRSRMCRLFSLGPGDDSCEWRYLCVRMMRYITISRWRLLGTAHFRWNSALGCGHWWSLCGARN